MLYLVGLGLGDEKDITVKGLEAIRSCSKVFLDAYTSILGIDKSKLEKFYQVEEIILADREMVELEADRILADAKDANVAFLVVGDPLGATTHTDLYLRAVRRDIPTAIIHNASIINAIGACGLQLYSYGSIVTMPFFTDNWRPESPYTKIVANWKAGLHTLCLLDIKVKEQSEENLLKGKKIYEPPRYMTVKQAVEQLLEIEGKQGMGVCKPDSIGIGMMRIGAADQKIIVGTLEELVKIDDEVFGAPLHSFILPGKEIHELEYEMLQLYIPQESTLKPLSYQQYLQSL